MSSYTQGVLVLHSTMSRVVRTFTMFKLSEQRATSPVPIRTVHINTMHHPLDITIDPPILIHANSTHITKMPSLRRALSSLLPPPSTKTSKKKAVHFTSSTKSSNTTKRTSHEYQRAHQSYVPGKYRPSKSSGGSWLDTSFMQNFKYHLLHLHILSIPTVKDEAQLVSIRSSYEEQMKGRVSLLASDSGNKQQVKDHVLRQGILDLLVDTLCSPGNESLLETFCNDMLLADALVVYKNTEGKCVDAQLVRDTYWDRQADEFVVELRQSWPVENVGKHRDVVLRRLRGV